MRFKEKPAWPGGSPNQDGANASQGDPQDTFEAKPGTLMLFGGAWGFDRDLIRYQELMFLMNAAASLALDADDQAILDLNNKHVASRAMGPFPEGTVKLWKFAQVGGHAILLTIIGLVVWRFRLARRERYRLLSAG